MSHIHEQRNEIKGPSGPALQENLITLICHDDEHGEAIIEMIGGATLFEGEYKGVAERVVTYWAKYHKAPKAHLFDLFDDILTDKHNRRGNVIAQIIAATIDLYPQLDREVVLSQLGEFVQTQRAKITIMDMADTVQAKQGRSFDKIDELIADYQKGRPPAKGHTWNNPDVSLLDGRRGNLPEFPLDTIRSTRLRKWIEDAAHAAGSSGGSIPPLGTTTELSI